MKTTVASIDFGTSKIVTLVAENSSATRCDIVGAGIVTYNGFLEEGWNDPQEIDDCLREAISQAEKQSHHKIREVNIGVPGAFTRVYVTEARVSLTGPDPHVTANDVRAIFAEAQKNLGTLPGEVVHSSPAWFRVDDGKKTLEPVGIKGRELTALISFVVANKYFLDDVSTRLANMDIKPKNFFSTPAGEAMLYLPEEDRDRTAVLIDVGYLNTEVMAVEGDALIFHRCIGLGGGHIAADLAEELDISFKNAEEKVKQPFVYSMSATPETYEIPANGDQPARTFTREEVSPIITAKVDELAEEIKTALEESGVKLGNWSNVYLTGGGLSFNRGGKDYLSSKLGRPVRDTPKRTVKMSSPIYSSTMGLMDLIIDTMEQQRQPASGVAGKLGDFFRSLVGG
ncbi:MAG: cell division FtsA domain-containing protein [Aristaeellaceae bacterium]